MGLNVDLCQMLNAPKKLDCQHCGAPTKTDFDDYDIEGGIPTLGRGSGGCCDLCEHNSYWE